LGLLLGLNLTVGIIAVGLAVAALIAMLQAQRAVPVDSLLGIATHATLAAGLVVIGLLETVRIDLMAYLFGDILSVGMDDVAAIYAGSALALCALALIWRPLIAVTVNAEMAAAEGVPVARVRATFLLLIALMVALAIKVVGALLVIALLIIPPATARSMARTPETMAIMASLLGLAAIGTGLGLSLAWNVPTGPAIVLMATVLFVFSIVPAVARAVMRR
jgi:zinc transport system permease protein